MATTWNPSDKGAGVTLSGGNLGVSVLASGTDSVRATASEASAKRYFELAITSGTGAGMNLAVGVANASAAITGTFLGGDANAMVYRGSDGAVKQNATTRATFATFGSGDTIGVAFDATARTVSFYKNNVLQGTLSTNVPTGALYPVTGGEGGGTATAGTANFGATTFTYTPPTGYSGFDTASLIDLVMTGGISFGGAASYSPSSAVVMSGGISFGGAATIDFHSSLLAEVTTDGGMTFGGAAAYEFVSGVHPIISTAPMATALLTSVTGPSGFILGQARVGTAALSGISGFVATITTTAPKALAALFGGPQSIAASAPMASATLTGFGGVAAVILANAPRAASSFSAVLTAIANIVATAPKPSISFEVAIGNTGSVTAQAPSASAKLTSLVSIFGTITAQAPIATTAFAGGMGYVTTIIFNAPMARAYLTNNETLDTLVKEMVVNTVTSAVTEYDNYGFDSFATIGGVVYAAGADGIYELDSGTKDNTAPVHAFFETGALSFGSEYLKRMESLYAAYRTSGDILVTVSTDEGKKYSYSMKYDKAPTIKQRRVPIGKGMKGKYWQCKIENVNGATFGFDTFNILIHETVRRIGV